MTSVEAEGTTAETDQGETSLLLGSFVFDSSDDVDQYLKELGVGLVFRKVKSVEKPNLYISHSKKTNHWTIKTESVFNKKENTFKPTEKFPDQTFDNRKCESTVEVLEGGNGLKLLQTCDEGPSVETTMTATDTILVMELKSGEFKCVLRFHRGDPISTAPIAMDRNVRNLRPFEEDNVGRRNHGIDEGFDGDW